MSRPHTPVATGARTWLAVTRSGQRFAFSATSPGEARKRAMHETPADERPPTIRPYLEVTP